MRVVLQHISIPRPPTDDSPRLARKFYGELVGLEEKPVPDTIAHLSLIWFKIGEDTELHVFAEEGTDQKSTRHFCLNVGDVEAMRATLTQGGFEPWAAEEIRGRPRFFCRDPFGNVVEFTEITDDYLKYQDK